MKNGQCLTHVRAFRGLRHPVAAIFLLAFIPTISFAQSQSERRGWGYGFIALGGSAGDGSATALHYGGGGERLIYRGLGVGAELGNVTPTGDFGQGLGILSANMSYNFGGRQRSKKISPFVTGGYSLKFRDDEDSGGGLNLGAGVQYWASNRLGVRVEFRDHHFFKGVLNFYGVRVGLAFR
jgi:opacity protein-like surface antigen